MRIVIVEDNENLRESLRAYLELEDFIVIDFGDIPAIEKGVSQAAVELLALQPDCIILDVMLPSGNGLLLGKSIREQSTVPLMFLTARVSESDRITGLEVGADDYVTKPFSPRELVLRVKALLRRWTPFPGGSQALGSNSPSTQEGQGFGKSPSNREPAPASAPTSAVTSPGTFRFGLTDSTLEIHTTQHWARIDSQPLKITPAEWNILEFLVHHPRQVFSRMQLLEYCLASVAEGSERTVDTHIKNLRQKLGNPDWIETERGFGYRFIGEELS